MLRIALLLLLLISSYRLFADGYELSESVKLPLTGWNKVLQVSNGNTLLFHLEPRMPIVVKVFDKNRKEIASEKFLGKLVDMMALERSEIHGIYEINGEAVIFISQAVLNKETLVRVCFNIETGKLKAEKKVIESQSFKKRLSFSLVRDTMHGGYAVFCMKDLVANYEDDSWLEVFDEQHNSIKKVVYRTNRAEFDFTTHASTCIGNDGTIAVMLDCSKIINYPKENQHSIVTCYLPYGDTGFVTSITKLPRYVSTDYGFYSYNEFGKKLNLFLVGGTTMVYKNGLQTIERPKFSAFMLRYLKSNMGDMDYSLVNYSLANNQFSNPVDSTDPFMPLPLTVYTNKFGMNTLISEDIKQNLLLKNRFTSHTYFGDIVVSHINDEGKEIWSTTLSKRQFLDHSVNRHTIKNRGRLSYVFRRADPEREWMEQFVSFNSVMTAKGDCFIVHNDYKLNFEPEKQGYFSPVSNYTDIGFMDTDAFYYKITRKHEVTKHYLFEPSESVNYAVSIESADYCTQNQTYACLVVQNQGGKKELKMGWKKLGE